MRKVISLLGALVLVLAFSVPAAATDGRVTLCHIPPGNPDAAHTITIGAPGVAAHLAHGDYFGPCACGPG